MQSPGSAFSDNFMRGFSLMDAYYSRQETNKRADARDARQADSHIINMENAGLKNKKLKREDWANQYQNIISDDNGKPVSLQTLTKDQLNNKKKQFVGFLNGYEPLKADLISQNPNRESISGIDIIMDNKTGKPMMVVNFKMKDGSIKPMTANASADPKDRVQLVGLDQVDNIIQGYLGQDMGAKPSMREARATTAASDAATLKHQRAVEIANIKEGGSSGRSGLSSKQKVSLQNKTYSLNNSNYGSSGLSGLYSFEGDKAQKRNVANVISDHLINSGLGTDAGTISAQAVQKVDDIYSNGGSVSYNKAASRWEAWDGSFDENGNEINVIPLNSKYKPDQENKAEPVPKTVKAKTNSGKPPTRSQLKNNPEYKKLRKLTMSDDVMVAKDANRRLTDLENGWDGGEGLDGANTKPNKPDTEDGWFELLRSQERNKDYSDKDLRAEAGKLTSQSDRESLADAQARKNIDARKKENNGNKGEKGKVKYSNSLEDRQDQFFIKQEEKAKSSRRKDLGDANANEKSKAPYTGDSAAEKAGNRVAKRKDDALRKIRYYKTLGKNPDSKYAPSKKDYEDALESSLITDEEKNEIKKILPKGMFQSLADAVK